MYELYALAAVSNNEEAYYDIFNCYKPSWWTSDYRDAYLKATVSSKMIVEDLLNTTEGQNILNEAYRLADYPIVELQNMKDLDENPKGLELYKVIAAETLRYHERIELMIAITKKVKELDFNSDELIKVNIQNFTVGKKMEVSFVDNVSDMRCRNLFASSSNCVMYPLYQLGIIFYQILTGEPFIPEILNSDQTELIWNRYLMKMYQKCTVSSMSLAILCSCLSDRNLETVSFGRRQLLKMDDIGDIDLDPPIFINISDMEKALEKEMTFLKRYQVKDIPAEGEEADDVILMQVTNISKNFNPMDNDEEIF